MQLLLKYNLIIWILLQVSGQMGRPFGLVQVILSFCNWISETNIEFFNKSVLGQFSLYFEESSKDRKACYFLHVNQ